MPRSSTTEREFCVPPAQAGFRLDKALALSGPPGLRGWRRFCEAGLVLVDERPASPALKLRAGQRIRLLHTESVPPEGAPRVVALSETFAALFKPSGWHSVALPGSTLPSVEALLGRGGLLPATGGFAPCLLNRLDGQTSGLLVAGRTPEASVLWHGYEDAGEVCKHYLAVVHGLPDKPLVIRAGLDTADRRRVKVLAGAEAPRLRHTRVQPLRRLEASDLPGAGSCGLVVCSIRKGARHQIRAHLAHAGHPLVGDALYGGSGSGFFLLHHYQVRLPGFQAEAGAPWTFLTREDAEAAARAAHFPGGGVD